MNIENLMSPKEFEWHQMNVLLSHARHLLYRSEEATRTIDPKLSEEILAFLKDYTIIGQ